MNGWGWAFFALVGYLVGVVVLNLVFTRPVKLWERGRWALIFEPCDCWVGGYYDREDRELYIIFPIPMLPIRYRRA